MISDDAELLRFEAGRSEELLLELVVSRLRLADRGAPGEERDVVRRLERRLAELDPETYTDVREVLSALLERCRLRARRRERERAELSDRPPDRGGTHPP